MPTNQELQQNLWYSPGVSAVEKAAATAAAATAAATNPAMPGVTNPYTGFASQFPSGINLQDIYRTPQALLPYTFPGIDPRGMASSRLTNLPFDPLIMFTIAQGRQGGESFARAGEGSYANWLNDLYRLMTGGGRGFSARELASNVLGAPRGSQLSDFLTTGDPNQQARTLFNMLSDVASASMNPMAATAYQTAARRAIEAAISKGLTDPEQEMGSSLYQRVAQIAPQLLAR